MGLGRFQALETSLAATVVLIVWKNTKKVYKIHRGPKLEGCAFANFGNSSGTEGESRHNINWKIGVNKLLLSDGSLEVLKISSSKLQLRGRKTKKGSLVRVLKILS